MIIKTIERSLSREYNIMGLKEWKGARMVAEINETEDEYECGKELERKVERQLGSNNNYENAFGQNGIIKSEPPIQPPVIDRKIIDRIEKLIDDAKTIEELAIYESEAEKHGLKDQFDFKMAEFIFLKHG